VCMTLDAMVGSTAVNMNENNHSRRLAFAQPVLSWLFGFASFCMRRRTQRYDPASLQQCRCIHAPNVVHVRVAIEPRRHCRGPGLARLQAPLGTWDWIRHERFGRICSKPCSSLRREVRPRDGPKLLSKSTLLVKQQMAFKSMNNASSVVKHLRI